MTEAMRVTSGHIVERVRRLLGGQPARVQAAALPYRRNGDHIEVLLVTSRDTGRWILPKGWPERDEALHRAAEREAFEEAGIRGHVSEHAIGTYRLGRGRRPTRPVEIIVFPLQVESVADEWPEADQRQRVWLTSRKAARRLSEPALAAMVAAFHGNSG